MGKATCSDIEKGKMTLPLIYLMKELPVSERKWLSGAIFSNNGSNIGTIRRKALEYGADEHSLSSARKYSQKASDEMRQFEDSRLKQNLLCLLDYVTERKS
jgi:octaprenyl-diphosphate synthase